MHSQLAGHRYRPFYTSTMCGGNAFFTLLLNDDLKQHSKLNHFLVKKRHATAGLTCALQRIETFPVECRVERNVANTFIGDGLRLLQGLLPKKYHSICSIFYSMDHVMWQQRTRFEDGHQLAV